MFQKVLLATDGSGHSMKAADYALQLAKSNNAQVEIVYVNTALKTYSWSDMGEQWSDWKNQLMNEGKEILEQTTRKFKEADISYTSKVMIGDPADVILDVAKRKEIKLIVIGAQGKSALSRFLLGSISNKVVAHAPCPVLVVR